MPIKKIVMLGAGNLATQLSKVLIKKGFELDYIYSRTFQSAQKLAEKLSCKYSSDINLISQDADLYIIAVSDNAISEIIRNFPFPNKLITHTSGSTNMNVFEGKSSNYGVFYPFQTFTKEGDVDFSKIPFCIEGSSNQVISDLMELAKAISQNVLELSSHQRRVMHLGAVFACNFTNHFYALADEFLKENNIPFELLFPLITETARKAVTMPPRLAQTGPAIRGEDLILKSHKEILKGDENLLKLYTICTKSIQDFYQEKIEAQFE